MGIRDALTCLVLPVIWFSEEKYCRQHDLKLHHWWESFTLPQSCSGKAILLSSPEGATRHQTSVLIWRNIHCLQPWPLLQQINGRGATYGKVRWTQEEQNYYCQMQEKRLLLWHFQRSLSYILRSISVFQGITFSSSLSQNVNHYPLGYFLFLFRTVSISISIYPSMRSCYWVSNVSQFLLFFEANTDPQLKLRFV